MFAGAYLAVFLVCGVLILVIALIVSSLTSRPEEPAPALEPAQAVTAEPVQEQTAEAAQTLEDGGQEAAEE